MLSGNAYLVQAHAGGISLLGKYHFGASLLQFGLAAQSQEWPTFNQGRGADLSHCDNEAERGLAKTRKCSWLAHICPDPVNV